MVAGVTTLSIAGMSLAETSLMTAQEVHCVAGDEGDENDRSMLSNSAPRSVVTQVYCVECESPSLGTTLSLMTVF
jgi:hypothetical protein